MAPSETAVSIIIPAYNAASTLRETLDSLRAQTAAGWEAIIIDDGSADDTAAIARAYGEADSRFHVAQQANAGVSAARNRGIALANHPWLLFLDADDWLYPGHLERLAHELRRRDGVDVLCCGWVRVAQDGSTFPEHHWKHTAEPFAAFARGCPVAMHACVARRSLVSSLGGFDTALRTCEDWDLWQRIARAGGRFESVANLVVPYRVKPDSESQRGTSMLADGLRVLERGHTADQRVPSPVPRFAGGLDPHGLTAHRLTLACWAAGHLIGRNEDARTCLSSVAGDHDPQLDARWVADALFETVPLPRGQSPREWPALFRTIGSRLDEFLAALEQVSGAPDLATRARAALQERVNEFTRTALPASFYAVHAVRVELTTPTSDVAVPGNAARIRATVELEGQRLGSVDVPACDGAVPAGVLLDAIAAEFSWEVLGRFFGATVYRTRSDGDDAHERIGWETLLQELLGRPGWKTDRFYDPATRDPGAATRRVTDAVTRLELSEELPDLLARQPEIWILPTIGGIAIGAVAMRAENGIVSRSALRARICDELGVELCRIAVREGVFGRPLLSQPISLRARLADVARRAARADGDQPPAWLRNGVPTLPSSAATLVLGRRHPSLIGTSASRRYVLPVAAAAELSDAAAACAEPVLNLGAPAGSVGRVVYAPELIGAMPAAGATVAPQPAIGSGSSQGSASARHQFEALFASGADPWAYTSPYEQTKYEQTLSLLPAGRIPRALELACAEGHFTLQLAPLVGSLVSADISQIALERASVRCRGADNVQFTRLDLTTDAIPGTYDLVVCSEVLYFTRDRATLDRVARSLAGALNPGGHLVTAHANLVVDDPGRAGFDWAFPFGARVIGEALARTPGLALVREIRTPLYRIQLFRHGDGTPASAPEIIELAQPTPPPPRAVTSVRWHGAAAANPVQPTAVVTERLPILAYHRIADHGSDATQPYRVTPAAFSEQLSYLRDAGFRCVTLEDWRRAQVARRPLRGRAVLITFDDGYLDFGTTAWPLLQQWGFTATVHLVTDNVGRTNAWDANLGESVPLLDWSGIRALAAAGVEFGSHTATHVRLAELPVDAVVREAARSRAAIATHLGRAPSTLAYPYGSTSAIVQHFAGAAGYVFGLTCEPRPCRFEDRLLALPRIEVFGTDSLEDFIAKLPA